MRLTQPKKNVFWSTIIIAAISLITFVVSLFISEVTIVEILSFALMFIAFLYLALACALKGL